MLRSTSNRSSSDHKCSNSYVVSMRSSRSARGGHQDLRHRVHAHRFGTRSARLPEDRRVGRTHRRPPPPAVVHRVERGAPLMTDLLLIGQQIGELHPAMSARLRVRNRARIEQFHQRGSRHSEKVGGFLRRQDDTLRLESDGLTLGECVGCVESRQLSVRRQRKRLAIYCLDSEGRRRFQAARSAERPRSVSAEKTVCSVVASYHPSS